MIPCSEVDKNAWDTILSVPWLKESVVPTGSRWGRRIADVKLSRLPQNLLGLVLIPEDSEEELLLVIYRCDRYDYMGWEAFPVTLTLPDGTIYEVEVPRSVNIKDGHSIRVPINSGHRVSERKQQLSRHIPRVIYNLSVPLDKQLSHEVRRFLKNIRRMSDLMHCTSLYLVIEDEAGKKEVENSNVPGFKEAYAALRPGSYKADMLRYYLLWKYGGIYLDDKTFLRYSLDSNAFDSILNDCEVFVSIANGVEIAFMGAQPGCPVMLKALQTTIDNVARRFYSNHRLGITGNVMFQKIVDDEENIRQLALAVSKEQMLYENDILWQRKAIPSADWPKPATYYADLWEQGQVYTDGNPPVPLRMGMSYELRREIIAYTITILAIIGVGYLISRYSTSGWF